MSLLSEGERLGCAKLADIPVKQRKVALILAKHPASRSFYRSSATSLAGPSTSRRRLP